MAFYNFEFHTSLWISVRLLCDIRSFAAKGLSSVFLPPLSLYKWFSCSVQDLWHKSFDSENCCQYFQQMVDRQTVTFTITKPCYLHSTKLERFSLSDKLQTNHYDCWRSWNYSIYERVVDLYVEAKTVLYSMFVLEAIVPRACTSSASGYIGNLGTKLLFLNFRLNCARSVNGQWNAELKRIFPEVFVFPFRWTKVTRALGTRLPVVVVPFRCRCLRSLMSTGSPASHSLRSRSHALRWPNFFHTSLARWEPVRRLVCLVILYHL